MAKTVDIWKETRPVLLPPAQSNEEKMQFVCVNGRRFQVPKGKTVMVPLPVYEALREAQRANTAAIDYERAESARSAKTLTN